MELSANDNFKPITVIATTHGCIPCNLGMYKTTNVPDGMELIKISISETGKKCLFNSKMINNTYINIINNVNPVLTRSNLTTEVLLNVLQNYVFKQIKKGQQFFLDFMIKNEKFKTGIDDEGPYLNSSGFKIHILSPGSIISNKLYGRHFGDKNINDFSIVELNPSLNPSTVEENNKKNVGPLFDLFTTIYPNETYPHDYAQQLYLSQILNHYSNNSFTRVFLFDFTCSSFLDGSNECCDENEINDIINSNAGIPTGGKYKKKYKYKKSYKNKNNKKRKTIKSKKRKTIKSKKEKQKTKNKKNKILSQF